MPFIVSFEDNAHLAEQRARHMQAHLEFLDQHADRIKGAGPVEEAHSGLPAGGYWLVEAETVAEVWSLVHEDPLWETGLRRSIRLLRWNRVR